VRQSLRVAEGPRNGAHSEGAGRSAPQARIVVAETFRLNYLGLRPPTNAYLLGLGPGCAVKRWVKSSSTAHASRTPISSMMTKLRQSTML